MRRFNRLAAAFVLVVASVELARADGQFPAVSASTVVGWQEGGEEFLLVDVRPPALYEMKHARGAVNIPAFVIDAKPIPRWMRVVVYDGGAGATEADAAATALRSKGQSSISVLEGGLTAWEAGDHPIVAPLGPSPVPFVEPITAEALQRLIDKAAAVRIVDVRPGARSGESAIIPGAIRADGLAALQRTVGAFQRTDLIVVFDNGDGSALIKAEELRRQGYRAVKYLYGGTLGWEQKTKAAAK
jgi:rhodanese-related sulfurtransferase